MVQTDIISGNMFLFYDIKISFLKILIIFLHFIYNLIDFCCFKHSADCYDHQKVH